MSERLPIFVTVLRIRGNAEERPPNVKNSTSAEAYSFRILGYAFLFIISLPKVETIDSMLSRMWLRQSPHVESLNIK